MKRGVLKRPAEFSLKKLVRKLPFFPRSRLTVLFSIAEKFFRNKLLLSFLAIVLVIKLIKIKVLWILPLIVGVTTAKKLVLKFVLFLFPALANIFKLCSYYHKNYHDTKFHHHQHHISHLHTVSIEMNRAMYFT